MCNLTLGPNTTTQPNYVGCTQESGFNYNGLIATTNRIVASGFCYDDAGNMTASPGFSYVYAAENHLTSTAGVTYAYDGDGKRLTKSNGTMYWYGASSDPLIETDLSNNLKSHYIFFNGQRVASDNGSNQINWYFADHLGTARLVFSVNGDDQSDFYPFGGERVMTASAGNHYKFTAKERDSESGLDNFAARFNSSTMGRFMSADDFSKDSQVGDPQSWNKYVYTRDNPLRYTDPSGGQATESTSCTTDSQGHVTCNVTITATIAIYSAPGADLSQDQLNTAATTIKSSIEGAWNGSTEQDGVTYNVSTQITVQVAGSEGAANVSGAQNVIGLTDGSPNGKDGGFVDPRGAFGALTGLGPDTGQWDINQLDNYAKHEFTHLLGTYDKDGNVLSNKQPASRPNRATSQDLLWGIREATKSVGRDRSEGLLIQPGTHNTYTDQVQAGYIWWK